MPFLPPSQQRQSTEGTSTESTGLMNEWEKNVCLNKWGEKLKLEAS